jgi:hypothetical protein
VKFRQVEFASLLLAYGTGCGTGGGFEPTIRIGRALEAIVLARRLLVARHRRAGSRLLRGRRGRSCCTPLTRKKMRLLPHRRRCCHGMPACPICKSDAEQMCSRHSTPELLNVEKRSFRIEERRMRGRSITLTVAAALISAGTPAAQTPTTDHSGISTAAQITETTGQTQSFEDRWPAQAAVPYLPSAAPVPTATAPAPETTGQATVSKKGDLRPPPDPE